MYATWGLNQLSAYCESLDEIENHKTIQRTNSLRAAIGANAKQYGEYIEGLTGSLEDAAEREAENMPKEYALEDIPVIESAETDGAEKVELAEL